MAGFSGLPLPDPCLTLENPVASLLRARVHARHRENPVRTMLAGLSARLHGIFHGLQAHFFKKAGRRNNTLRVRIAPTLDPKIFSTHTTRNFNMKLPKYYTGDESSESIIVRKILDEANEIIQYFLNYQYSEKERRAKLDYFFDYYMPEIDDRLQLNAIRKHFDESPFGQKYRDIVRKGERKQRKRIKEYKHTIGR